MKIKQVRFHGKRAAVKRWPHSNIRHRAIAPRIARKNRARDVHAARGQQFLLRRKVQRGKSKFAPVPVPLTTSPDSTNGRPINRPGMTHISVRDLAADNRAGHNFAAVTPPAE